MDGSQVHINHSSKKAVTRTYATARIISDLANPLFIPPLVLIVSAWILEVPIRPLSWLAALALLFYTFIPLGITLLLLRKGHIRSLDLPEQKSRNRLYLYSIISTSSGSLLLAYFLQSYDVFLSMLAVVFLLNPLLGYLLNLKWKISVHSASLASAGAIFMVMAFTNPSAVIHQAGALSLIILSLLLPLMIWARYHLNVHTISELAGGVAAGFLLTLFELSIMISLL